MNKMPLNHNSLLILPSMYNIRYVNSRKCPDPADNAMMQNHEPPRKLNVCARSLRPQNGMGEAEEKKRRTADMMTMTMTMARE